MSVSIEKSPGRASSSGATLAPQARHTAKSFSKVSHFYLRRDLEISCLLELRDLLRKGVEPAPFITHSSRCSPPETLSDHPRLNAHYADDDLELSPRIDLGIAVVTDEGLVRLCSREPTLWRSRSSSRR
jgi:pyruvate/2-oxoglutarate dehydrogenase complex dihydrolipoamide acyltransferase (E2) component